MNLLALLLVPALVDGPITFFGFGPIRVGATVAAASKSAGEPLHEANDKPSGGDTCHHVRLASTPSILFMVEEGRITRVETDDPSFQTASGARMGDSEERVKAIYGRRLEIEEHKYDENGHNLIVRSQDRRYALVMETDGKQVVYIRAGLVPSAEYVEGCL